MRGLTIAIIALVLAVGAATFSVVHQSGQSNPAHVVGHWTDAHGHVHTLIRVRVRQP